MSTLLFGSHVLSYQLWVDHARRTAKPITLHLTDGNTQTVSGEEWFEHSDVRFHPPLWVRSQLYISMASLLCGIVVAAFHSPQRHVWT